MKRFLTEEQLRVVEHDAGHAIVSAVAGSGKTTVLEERILRLLGMGVDHRNILAVQFNKDAQTNLQNRLNRRLEASPAPRVATFHSVGLGMLKKLIEIGELPKTTLIKGYADTKIQRNALKKSFSMLPGDMRPPPGADREFAVFITHVKARLSGASEVFDNGPWSQELLPMVKAFEIYADMLCQQRKHTFDDMLYLPVKHLVAHPDLWEVFANRFDELMIDEFQDTNEIQFELVSGLAGSRANVMAVGDIDQAIYSFRGASTDFLLGTFEKRFNPCTRYPLQWTFRFGHAISLLANNIITRNRERDDKLALSFETNPDTAVRLHQFKSPKYSGLVDLLRRPHHLNELSSYCMPVRFYSQSIQYEIELTKAGIPFHVYGREPLLFLPEIAVMVAALAISANHWPIEEESIPIFLQALLQVPSLYLDGERLEALTEKMMATFEIDPRQIHLPILELARDQSLSPVLAKRLENRADAIRLMGRDAMQKESPGSVLTIFDKVVNFTESLKKSGFTDEESQESVANAKAFMEMASGYQSTRELLDVLGPQAANKQKGPPSHDHFKIMSVHSSKGLEFPNVVLVGLAAGQFPRDLDDIEEERRLCYVAVTRCMNSLHIFHPPDPAFEKHIKDTELDETQTADRKVSPFLFEAEIGLASLVYDAIMTKQPIQLKSRYPNPSIRYLRTMGIPTTGLLAVESARQAFHGKPITNQTKITLGMRVNSRHHGDCEVVSKLYGAVYQLRVLTTGHQFHDFLQNNGYTVAK